MVTIQTTKFARYGVTFRVKPEDCLFIRSLDAQKDLGTGIFGTGFLLSEKAAAEKAEAEKAAAEARAERQSPIVLELSERELELQRGLGK